MHNKSVMILGGDGFCGWPTSLSMSKAGYEVTIIDNLSRRRIDEDLECESLTPITSIDSRLNAWYETTGKIISYKQLDIARNYNAFKSITKNVNPSIIIHFAEQRAAPCAGSRCPDLGFDDACAPGGMPCDSTCSARCGGRCPATPPTTR